MDYLSEWLFLLLGGCLGIISSAVFWWIQHHYIVPKFEFSEEISKKKDYFTGKGWVYRIKMKNRGSRNAIDMTIFASFGIRNLHYGNLTWVSIPTSPKHIAFMKRRTGDRVIRFRLERLNTNLFQSFPSHINRLYWGSGPDGRRSTCTRS